MHKLGIMQGRLSPMVDGKIQAFPSSTWRDEFALARNCGFDFLEWILDLTDLESNPILTDEGRSEIVQLQKEFSIDVPIICVDYFMEHAFQAKELNIRLQALGMLCELIRVCPEVNIRRIEIPLIGQSSIENEDDERLLVELLTNCLPSVERRSVHLLLEMDLPPKRVQAFIKRVSSDLIQLVYDTGNSAYKGFRVQKEIPLYGKKIGAVHIKDCTPEDYSLPLGKGDVDFELTFKLLQSVGYRGDFVLQAARGDDHVKVATEYGLFTRSYIRRYLNGP